MWIIALKSYCAQAQLKAQREQSTQDFAAAKQKDFKSLSDERDKLDEQVKGIDSSRLTKSCLFITVIV